MRINKFKTLMLATTLTSIISADIFSQTSTQTYTNATQAGAGNSATKCYKRVQYSCGGATTTVSGGGSALPPSGNGSITITTAKMASDCSTGGIILTCASESCAGKSGTELICK